MANQPYTIRLAEWLFSQDWYEEEADKAMRELFPEAPPELSAERIGDLEIFVNQWILYDRPTALHGQKPIDIFLETRMKRQLVERAIYQQFARSWIGLFEVMAIKPHEELRLRDLITDVSYSVAEDRGTIGPRVGDIMIARMMPFGDGFILGAGFGLLSGPEAESSVYLFKRLSRGGNSQQLSAVDLAKWLFGQTVPKTYQKWSAILELDEYLKQRGYIKRSAADILREFEQYEKPDKVLDSLAKDLGIATPKEFEPLASRLVQLWNLTRAKPPTVEYPGRGPLESVLVDDLLQVIGRAQQRKRPDSMAAAHGLAEREKDIYLKTPQPELHGRTPWQAILDERQQRGNHDTGFGYEFTAYHIGPSDRLLGLVAKAHQAFNSGRFKQALNLYKKIISDKERLSEIWRIHGNAGAAAYRLAQPLLAEKYLTTALQLNPKYGIARRNLKRLRAEHRLVDKTLHKIVTNAIRSEKSKARRKAGGKKINT